MSLKDNRHRTDTKRRRIARLTSLLITVALLFSCGIFGLPVNAEASQSSPAEPSADTSDAHPGREHDTDPQPDTDPDPAPDTDGEPDTDPETDPDTEPDREPEDGPTFTTASLFLDLYSDCVYTSVTYDNKNGLPTSEANAIAQTSDGFIWIGGYGGLFRYDSTRFERIEPEGINGVLSLFTDSQDRLWIGTVDNGIAMMTDNRLRCWNGDSGFVSCSVNVISEDESGMVYFGTDSGLATAESGLTITMCEDERLKGKYIYDLKKGPDGLVYGLDKEGHVFTLKDGKVMQYCDSGCENPVCLLPDPLRPGSLYLSSLQTQYYGTIDSGSSSVIIEDTFINGLSNTKNMEYAGGYIWYCSSLNIYAFRPEDHLTNYVLRGKPINSSLGHVMQDYQGNFWFTSAYQGVVKTVPSYFLDINKEYAYSTEAVNCTHMYSSILMMGTDAGILMFDNTGSSYEFAELLYKFDFYNEIDDSTKVTYLFGGEDNALWIATWGKGLYRINDKAMTKFNESSPNAKLSSDYIHFVKKASDGSLLIAGEGGLDVLKDDKIVKRYGKNEGIANTSVYTVEEGLNGEILLGTYGGGIYIIEKDGSVKNLGKDDGLTSGIVTRIKKDRTRDLYWILTNDSVAYINADRRITTVTAFPYRLNHDIIQNSRDDMWVLSSDGIYVVPTEAMLRNENITPMHYGAENGLTRVPSANSYSELSDSGVLYIAANTGTIQVNIETAFQNDPEIRSCIPYIEADGEKLFPDESGNITVPSSTKRLVICGYVLNYSLTTPNVSYRLEGFDSENTTVNSGNLMPVDYTNLSGGDYRFEMKVFTNDGKQYSTSFVNITKQKAFYEEAWFYILITILGILLVVVTVQSIWVIRMKKLKAKHRDEVERERITTELETAGDIQNDMLPDTFPAFPDRNDFDIYAKMDPAKEVGGDFYDFFLTDDDHLCIIMADVSGKGIPAALFMMRSKIILQESAKVSVSPAEILRRANDSICANNKSEMFVSVWLGILELSTGRLIASNAGHEFPALTNEEGKFELYKDKHGMVVGGMYGYKYKEYELSLRPGSKLFLYTDGVPEANDADEQLFGFDRMIEALNEDPKAAPEQVLTNVRRHVDDFVKDAEQFDDLTMLCLEYKPESVKLK